MPVSGKASKAFWVCATFTLVSALVSAFFSVAGLLGDGRVDLYAMYAASRSVALPVGVLACIWFRSRPGLAAMALTMGLVQMFDGVIGVVTHNAGETYGPFVLGLATFVSLGYLLRGSDNAL